MRNQEYVKENKAKMNLNKMLITMCFLFLMGNLPLAIVEIEFVYQINIGLDASFSEKFSYFSNTCLFVYHTLDFFIYYIFNRQFRNGFKKVFFRKSDAYDNRLHSI